MLKTLNQLPTNDYDWVLLLNPNRPTDDALASWLTVREWNDTSLPKKLNDLKAFWDSYFSNCQNEKQRHEVEEWIERALLFQEVLNQIPNTYICTDISTLPKALKQLPVLGHIPGMNPHFYEKNNNLDNDLIFPELKEHLGRKISVVPADIEIFIKEAKTMLETYDSIYPKWLGVAKAFPVIELRDVCDINHYVDRDPYAFERLYHHKLAIQEGLNLQDERRFFVINGDIITSSSVRWYLTPLVLEHKSPYDVLLYQKAKGVVKSLKNGTSVTSQTYVIDVAWDKTNERAVLVEMNPIHNSGFYACDVAVIVKKAKENPSEFTLRQVD